jgi:hypothetical protein
MEIGYDGDQIPTGQGAEDVRESRIGEGLASRDVDTCIPEALIEAIPMPSPLFGSQVSVASGVGLPFVMEKARSAIVVACDMDEP